MPLLGRSKDAGRLKDGAGLTGLHLTGPSLSGLSSAVLHGNEAGGLAQGRWSGPGTGLSKGLASVPGMEEQDRAASVLYAARSECANPNCGAVWSRLFRRRPAHVFEGAPVCGEACLRAVVSTAVRREMGDGPAQGAMTPHHHRVPLGLVMLAQGWITQPQLQQALAAQRRAGEGRIGSWLVSECGVREERVTRALSMQWSRPVIAVDRFEPERMACLVPRYFIASLGLLPVRVAGESILYVGFEEQIDTAAAFAVERMTGLRVESGLVDGAEYERCRSRLLGQEMREHFAPVRLEAAGDVDALTLVLCERVMEAQPAEARLVRLREYYWLRMWRKGAVGGTGAGRVAGGSAAAADAQDGIYRVRGEIGADGVGEDGAGRDGAGRDGAGARL